MPLAVACGLDAVGTGTSATTPSTQNEGGVTPTPTSTSTSQPPPVDASPDTWSLAPRLTMTKTAAPGFVDLSAGSTDWAHWRVLNLMSVGKSGGTILAALTNVGGGAVEQFTGGAVTYRWDDGDGPTAGIDSSYVGNEDGAAHLRLTFAASDTKLRTAVLYVGYFNSRTRMTAAVSDGSSGPVVIERDDGSLADQYRVEVLAASANTTVVLDFVMLQRRVGGGLYVGAATVTE